MMHQPAKHIILAEDDEDDSQFFEEALRSIDDAPSLIKARDGVELTDLLKDGSRLPDLIFLDLNMPRKNGAQCLSEIRAEKDLQHLPVVVLSTSNSKNIIDSMYQSGANLYVQKPDDFNIWKRVLAKVLLMDWSIQVPHAIKNQFMLTEF